MPQEACSGCHVFAMPVCYWSRVQCLLFVGWIFISIEGLDGFRRNPYSDSRRGGFERTREDLDAELEEYSRNRRKVGFIASFGTLSCGAADVLCILM